MISSAIEEWVWYSFTMPTNSREGNVDANTAKRALRSLMTVLREVTDEGDHDLQSEINEYKSILADFIASHPD